MLIYANPTTNRPRRARGTSKKGPTMAKKKRARKATSRRRRTIHRNPTSRAAAPRKSRRRIHRNPSTGGKGILGEITSKDGLILLGSAAVAPVAVDWIADKVLPLQYSSGWTGIAARAAILGAAVYALDKYAKQRKAALGFAVGGGAHLIGQAVALYRVGTAAPAVAPALKDEIARNPALFDGVMSGSIDPYSLNGYDAVPYLSGYDEVPLGEDFESMN